MAKTMKEEGYKYIGFVGNKSHVLLDTNTNNYEVWVSGDSASYSLIYKNTTLEFAHTASDKDKLEAVI